MNSAQPLARDRDALCQQALNLRLGKRFEEALRLLESLQQAHPRYSALYQERGHCYAALKDTPHAIAAFEQAVHLNAALPTSWQMLHCLYLAIGDEANTARAAERLATLRNLSPEVVQAASLFADGELVAAERLLRAFLAYDGEHLEATRLLGRVCLARGLRADAELLLETVVRKAPGYRAARADFTRALLDQHKYAQARQALEPLLELDPNNRAFLRLSAEGCTGLGDYESGIGLFRRLLADAHPGPESAQLHLWIAFCLRAMGQQAQAIAGYRAALAVLPDCGEAWWGLANLKTYRYSDHDLASLRAAQAAPSVSVADQYHLCFALGKALEDEHHYAESWRCYERGNALKHEEVQYRPEFSQLHTQLSQQVCTRAFFAARSGWGVQDPDPIFILGLPRSGSTLIEQILASHPRVEGTQELANIQSIVMELRGRHTNQENPRYPQVLAQLAPQDLHGFGERFIRETRSYRRTDRPFFIDKLPDNFRDIGLIHLMLPNARIIDARREPMACCFGIFKQLFAGGQEFSYALDDIARYYRTYLALMRHWHEVLPGRILTVQHEDLVEDLEGSVRRILEHCDLPFDPACLKFHETERSVRTASSEQVRRPISRESLDQWRHYEPWLAALRETLGDALTSYRT